MPFDEALDDLYSYGIKQVAEECGVVAERVDEQHYSETMLERIYAQIENCDFIIAEMTGKNPNVFYEVGYAHAKKKLCILIAQDPGDIPFDLKHHNHIIYDGSIGDLKVKLASRIQWATEESEKQRLGLISCTVRTESGFLDRQEYSDIGSFDLLLDVRNEFSEKTVEIEAIYITTTPRWELSIRGVETPYEIITSGKYKRSRITSTIQKLSLGGFLQERVKFEATSWSKFSGKKRRDEYSAKGTVRIDIIASERKFTYKPSIDVTFDDIPF